MELQRAMERDRENCARGHRMLYDYYGLGRQSGLAILLVEIDG